MCTSYIKQERLTQPRLPVTGTADLGLATVTALCHSNLFHSLGNTHGVDGICSFIGGETNNTLNASFDVTNQDLQVEASKCGYKRRRGIAMHQNHIRLLGFKHFLNTVEDVRSNVKQSLTVLHDVEIIVWDYIENSQNLVEHLTVLRRNANNSLDTLACLELIYEWAHFYCFWPCAKDKHNCFHLITSYI